MIRFFIVMLLSVCAIMALLPSSPAQTAPAANSVRLPHYKETASGKVLVGVSTGRDATNLPGGTVQVRDYVGMLYRDGHQNEVTGIAQAPECRINPNNKTVGDAGPMKMFTPDTNLFVQGVGFFLSETNQVLLISNQVETRVARSMLRSGSLFAARTNVPAVAPEIVKIFSDRARFDFRAELLDYTGNVRLVDPQFTMAAPSLSIQFGSNQSIETMFARETVTFTFPGRGMATGVQSHYLANHGSALLDLIGGAADAEWHDGDQQASARIFTFAPDQHLWQADDRVRVRWPNPRTNAVAPSTFRLLENADHVTLTMTPDDREVSAMTATGNVAFTNEADHSHGTSGKAVYSRADDSLVLTESPVWANDQLQVLGDTLTSATNNKVFHAQGHGRVKLRVAGAGGGLSGSTNQWLYVTADDILSMPDGLESTRVTFIGDVHARLVEAEQLRDTLTADTLTVYVNALHQLERVEARGHVFVESAPDAAGIKRTVSCGWLDGRFSPATGFWQEIVARENAVLESSGADPSVAHNKLSAKSVTAFFSSVTDRLERAVADGAVDFTQTKAGKNIHATGENAVYIAVPNEQVELTRGPWAQTDKITIIDASRLDYDLKNEGVAATGHYRIIQRPAVKPGAHSAQPLP